MNHVDLLGRFARDPELKQSQSGMYYMNFTLAVKKRFAKEGKRDVDYIDCTAFGKKAELLAEFRKGNLIIVHGNLDVDSFKKDDETWVNRTAVLVEDITFVQSKAERDAENSEKQDTAGLDDEAPKKKSTPPQKKEAPKKEDASPFEDEDDDDFFDEDDDDEMFN